MSIANLISKVTGMVCVPDRLAHPRDAVTLDLWGYFQIDDFSCGAVAGWIVLEAFDRRPSFRKFYDYCSPTDLGGTPTHRLAHALRENGLGVQHLRYRISFARLVGRKQLGEAHAPVEAGPVTFVAAHAAEK